MARLLADTDAMKRQADQLEHEAGRLDGLAGQLESLKHMVDAGAYEGQLYSQVHNIVEDASNDVRDVVGKINTSSTDLRRKAREFEAANAQIVTWLNQISLAFVTAKEIFSPIQKFAEQSGFPVNQFETSSELIGKPLGRKPFNPEIDVTLWQHSFGGELSAEGTSKWGGVTTDTVDKIDFLEGVWGVKGSVESGGISVGPRAKFSVISAEHSEVIGNRDSAWAGRFQVKAGEVEGFAGLSEGTLGAKAGAKLVSIEASGGRNIHGYYVGVVGGVGVEMELGVAVGKKTRLDLGPFTLGLDIGEAIGD